MHCSKSMCGTAEATAGNDPEREAVGTCRGTQRGEAAPHGNTALQDHGACQQPNGELKLAHLKPEAKHVESCSRKDDGHDLACVLRRACPERQYQTPQDG